MTHKKYSMQVQSISISKDKYSLAEAKKWVDEHGYKKTVEEGPEFYHFRQKPPKEHMVYATKTISPGVELVVYRPAKGSGDANEDVEETKKGSRQRRSRKTSKRSKSSKSKKGGKQSKRSKHSKRSKKSIKRSKKSSKHSKKGGRQRRSHKPQEMPMEQEM